jgi:hypothetical protein
MSQASFWGLAKKHLPVRLVLFVWIWLDAHIVGCEYLWVKHNIPLSFYLINLLSLVINKSIKVHSKYLEMFLASLKLIDHFICLIKWDVLLSTKVKEGLIAFLEL